MIGATVWWAICTVDARSMSSVWWHVVIYSFLAFGFMTGLSAFRLGPRRNRFLGTVGAMIHGVILMTISIGLVIDFVRP